MTRLAAPAPGEVSALIAWMSACPTPAPATPAPQSSHPSRTPRRTSSAYIARRRQLRPSEEYRSPTDAEWDEFLGHFEHRRVALGDCGRAYSTPCIHEHSCIRCPLLRIDPAQRSRLEEIRDNLLARIAEAGREGWPAKPKDSRSTSPPPPANSPRPTSPKPAAPKPSTSASPPTATSPPRL